LQKIDHFLQNETNKQKDLHQTTKLSTGSYWEEEELLEKEASKNTLISLFFVLNDTFVEYLSNSERYGLLHQRILEQFLNKEDHWIVLFYYILGKFPETKGVANLFLNYDLKSNLLESPFTEEIHVLLKCQLIFLHFFLFTQWSKQAYYWISQNNAKHLTDFSPVF
jgi:hypothetical protein